VILVAGGTGRLGSIFVRRLRDAGQPVTVLSRDSARAEHLRALGGHVVVGDVRRPVTLTAASGAPISRSGTCPAGCFGR
jgi:NADH dehydrogenase